MKLRNKNQLTFQSCRYCGIGGSLFRVDSEEGTYYVCESHKKEKDFLRDVQPDGVEEEFGTKKGLLARAINYVKGA